MSENYPDMESYEIVEFIRNMSEGDMIEVYYQKGRFTHVKSVKLTVYDTGHGSESPRCQASRLPASTTELSETASQEVPVSTGVYSANP